MPDLAYSNEAQNVLNLFYQVDYMVYVEGPDDICFWETIFKKTSNLKIEIQDVGGCEELQPYIDKVYNGEIDAIIACDMDLKKFDKTLKDHNKIIRTRKYSIENSLINEIIILRIIKLLGRYSSKEIKKFNVNKWMLDFYDKTLPLIKLDIINFLFSKGVSVIGDNADRFMESKNSYTLSEDKIQQYIEKLGINLSEEEQRLLEEEIAINKDELSFWLRGHFLFSAALRFISYSLRNDKRRVTLSNDAFYASLIQAFDSVFDESNDEYIYYKTKINMIA
ncbi:DUF4435 domain-containing protein [Brenneria corticis]|uniref:DUF4435 domain-containing protein n=1 Tax=Brenneria corticis TaxID=2173106 RepID=A0A2U1TL08_9GAMM|nr:DUF4435 domain-containing protein [Brenneria sp. CFCC 11842]PWC10085.1 hypothetical protein DDT56_22670 [Brenneria sp. CFCC 11842]